MQLKFHTLDVFTTRKFCGNPLAVVLGAEALNTEQMQGIAREFNLSETTFVMAPDDPANTAKVRIFTPGHELPFAGHPTIGTSILLAELRGLSDVRLELKAGLTPVKISRSDTVFTATFTAPVVPDRVAVPLPEKSLVARGLGLAESDIGFDHHQPVVLQGGPRFFFVPLKSREALAKSKVCEPHWSQMMGPLNAAYLYTRGGDHPETAFRARMYAPGGGIPEDPATGSATALLAAQLLGAESLKDGTHAWRLEQGYEMGRPSELVLATDVAQGKIAAVRVTGSAVRITQGDITL